MDANELKAGQLVEVTDFEGRKLVRKAVEILGETVYICSQEEFKLSLTQNKEPICVGFNIEFVRPCHGT